MGAGPRGRGETRTRGGSDGGGILDEAAFRSPRRGRPKQSAGEGTSELERAAAKIEPEPEPLRAPAIVAFLTGSPAVAGRVLCPPRALPGGSRDLVRRPCCGFTAAAGLRGRRCQARPDGNLPPLAGIAAYRLDREEPPPPPPLQSAEEFGPPRNGEHSAALRVRFLSLLAVGLPTRDIPSCLSAQSLVGAARKTRGVPRPGTWSR